MSGGGTCSTGTVATSADPFETEVTACSGTSGGNISITEQSNTTSEPAGISFYGQEVVITTTATGCTASDPFSVVIRIHTSIVPAGEDETTTQIFRNGTLLLDCSASSIPCVSNRAAVGDNLEFTLLVASFSTFNFGVSVVAVTPTATATATPTPTPTATSTATATTTPTPLPGVHDAQLRRISTGFTVPVTNGARQREVFIKVRNQGPQTETIGVYMDIVPPGGPSDPFGCLPAGRVLVRNVILTAFGTPGDDANVFADDSSLTGTVGAGGLLTFSCTDAAGAAGAVSNTYKIMAVVDVHADDLAFCPAGAIFDTSCFPALADDDSDDFDNRVLRSAPRAK